MSTPKINASKGRRYTSKEKAEILAYVNKVNEEKGRGGQMAATKKFNLSPLTIASWIRSGITATDGTPVVAGGPIGKKLAELQSLHNQIVKAEKELAKMQSQFTALKAGL